MDFARCDILHLLEISCCAEGCAAPASVLRRTERWEACSTRRAHAGGRSGRRTTSRGENDGRGATARSRRRGVARYRRCLLALLGQILIPLFEKGDQAGHAGRLNLR